MRKHILLKFLHQSISTPIGIIIIVICALLVRGIFVWQVEKIKPPSVEIPIVKKPEVAKPEVDTSNWKTYRNEKYGFEVRYPLFTTLKEQHNEIQLRHSVPYIHGDPCDFKGDAPKLKDVTDFAVNIKIEDTKDVEPELSKAQAYEDKVNIGNLDGYVVWRGIENCGEYYYYFPFGDNRTLIVTRYLITELTAPIDYREQFLILPGIITTEREEQIFNQILSTFKFIK